MVVFIEVIGEDGQPEQIEVSTDDIKAQILATRELTRAMLLVAAAIRTGGKR